MTEVARLERGERGGQGACRAARRLYPVQPGSRTAGRHRHQSCRQPLRLGTGDARTRPGPARRCLADQSHWHRQPESHSLRCGQRHPARLDPAARRWSWSAAPGQEAVAGFVQALKEIDGVTRVGVQDSALEVLISGAAARGSSAARPAISSPSSRWWSPLTRPLQRPPARHRRRPRPAPKLRPLLQSAPRRPKNRRRLR